MFSSCVDRFFIFALLKAFSKGKKDGDLVKFSAATEQNLNKLKYLSVLYLTKGNSIILLYKKSKIIELCSLLLQKSSNEQILEVFYDIQDLFPSYEFQLVLGNSSVSGENFYKISNDINLFYKP